MRHYAAWFDPDSITPLTQKAFDACYKAACKDPAMIEVTSPRSAYHAASIGLSVLHLRFTPGDMVLVTQALPISDTEHVDLSSPFPWTAKPSHMIAALRSSIDESERKRLIPLAKHGLI